VSFSKSEKRPGHASYRHGGDSQGRGESVTRCDSPRRPKRGGRHSIRLPTGWRERKAKVQSAKAVMTLKQYWFSRKFLQEILGIAVEEGEREITLQNLKDILAVAQRTVAKYMIPRVRRPPSQNWTTFLRNHLGSMVSVDFLIAPTLNFHLLYVFIVLSHHRRRMGDVAE